MAKKLEDDVRTAFERATEGTGSPEDLIAAVRILVRDLKKEGRPPENVIVTIKRLCFVADRRCGRHRLERGQFREQADLRHGSQGRDRRVLHGDAKGATSVERLLC